MEITLYQIDLCGHATLASAWVLFNLLGYENGRIVFDSRSGQLSVARDGAQLVMNFPAQPPVPCDMPAEIEKAFGRQVSFRGGHVTCDVAGDRVFIAGTAVKYMEGKIKLTP